MIEANGALTIPDSLTIAPAQPGLLSFADRRLIAQHPDYSLISADSPAKQGEAITLYLVGMGATDVPVASGVPSPGVPLANAKSQPAVTIGGRTAPLIFAGLTPGAVGLYQINLFVPTGQTGDLAVVVTQNGVVANAAVIPVR